MKKTTLLYILTLFLLLTATTASAGQTLYVGPHEKYKTIQQAMYNADDGATIYVQPGTYKENVWITREVSIYGKGYPTVYGFYCKSGLPVTINGFKLNKYGISLNEPVDNLIRNNYFYNCGISIKDGHVNTIMNNQFSNGGIVLSGTTDNTLIGNTISKASVGLTLKNGASCLAITKNTFSYCNVGVQCQSVPSCLTGNVYKGNKVNIKIVK